MGCASQLTELLGADGVERRGCSDSQARLADGILLHLLLQLLSGILDGI